MIYFINILYYVEMLTNLLRVNKRYTASLLSIYENLIKTEGMNRDEKQIAVIKDLQRLNDQLIATHYGWKQYAEALSGIPKPDHQAQAAQSQKQEKKKGFFSFFSKQFSTARSIRVKGLYLYGGSGSGKSFLSDIFYNNLAIEEKKKMHFHEFMASIHAQLYTLQRQKKGYDPLIAVAQKTAKQTRLLYLDEFQVTDVADASILRRLFEYLINNELVLLATTNRPPQDLYKDGHQRQFFLKFIDFITEQCVIRDIHSEKDYRYELERDPSDKYITYINPVNEQSDQVVKRVITALTQQTKPVFTEKVLQPIPGRKLVVPRSSGLICVYTFEQLMEATMGDSDFRAICKNYKAIIIRDMRLIKREERNLANRLIKLFDEAYYRNVEIYIQARVGIDELINPVPQQKATTEQDFAMIRCKSRLMQFQTLNYKQKLSYIEQQLAKQKQKQKKQSKPSTATMSQQQNSNSNHNNNQNNNNKNNGN